MVIGRNEIETNAVFAHYHCKFWDEDNKRCSLNVSFGDIDPLEKRLFNWRVGYCRFGPLFICVKENAIVCHKYVGRCV